MISTGVSLPSQRELKSITVFFGIEELEDLLLVGLGVARDLLAAQRRPRLVAAAGVADQAGEVADQEDDGVPQLLEVLHLADEHRVPQVDVGGGGVEARLDQQGLVRLQRAQELLLEVLLADDLQRPLLEQVELFADGGKSHPT